jgi:UDP-glucose 4-epimerase
MAGENSCSAAEQRNCLVTGAGGFLGSAMVRGLLAAGHRVRATSLSRSCHPLAFQVVRADLRQPNVWEKLLEGVDWVFHFAAQTGHSKATSDPEGDRAINVAPILSLAQYCRDYGARPTIFFAGTITQAGVPQRLPLDETHEDRPVTIYDQHKLAAERGLLKLSRSLNLPVVSLRLPTLYGPGPDISAPDRGVINSMTRKAMRGLPLTLYRNGDWSREFLFIDDAVDAFLRAAALSARRPARGEMFVLGGCRASVRHAFGRITEIA